MKKLIFAALFTFISITSIYAKDKNVVWESPATEYANTYGDGFFKSSIDVTKVEMNDKETIVYLTAHMRNDYPNSRFCFAKETYLTANGKRYPVQKADNIELGEYVQTAEEGVLDFAFHFPALSKGIKSFDLIEGDGDSAFEIKGIKSAEERWNQLFPSYWRDDTSGDWVIAFFDDVVIYDSKFWTYKQNPLVNKDKATFTITDGNDILNIAIGSNKNGKRNIKIGDKAQTLSMITSRFLPDYPTKDTRPDFVNNGYKSDTITIVGWVKDLPESKKDKEIFGISYTDIITQNQANVYAKLDKNGRFTAKVPVMNSTEFFCDWELCFIRTMLEPGKTYFMLYDFKEGRRMFMGDDVRLQNELFKYPVDWNVVRWDNDFDHYIAASDSLINARYTYIDNLCKEHPTLSTRFEKYRKGNNLWNQAFEFGQSRFYGPNNRFSGEARKYAYDKFWSKLPETLTLHRYISMFINDFIGDMSRDFSIDTNGIILDHVEDYASTKEELTLLKRWAASVKEMFANLEAATTAEEQQKIAEEWNTKNEEIADRALSIVNSPKNKKIISGKILLEKINYNRHLLDSLGMSDYGKQIYLTRLVYSDFEQNRCSLSPEVIDNFKSVVKIPDAVKLIEEQNNRYLALENREFDKLVLKSNNNLHGINEGEQLVKKIIEPFKGKIVLIDVWGTWCSPCKESLSHFQEEYSRLAGYDIEFLFLANRSPQQSWENIIKEYNISGDNVAHYNLPEEQQDAIERYLGVNAFPTWKLIDKNGNILDLNVDARNLDDLERVIKELSKQ